MSPALFDTIIVGGDTAGCIVASRVSEYPHHQVLVLEAGPDYLPGSQGAYAAAVRMPVLFPCAALRQTSNIPMIGTVMQPCQTRLVWLYPKLV